MTAGGKGTEDETPSPPVGSRAQSRELAPSPLGLRHELARKALHLISFVVPLAYALGMPRRWLLVALGAGCIVALGVEVGRRRHARSRELFHRIAGPLLRPGERMGGLFGATWLLLAFVIATAAYPRPIAVAAMSAVSLGDAAAAVVGRTASRRLFRFGNARPRKTLEGSAACLLVTAVASLALARLSLAESLIAAIAATAAEWPESPLDDNLRIVLGTGIGILLWRIAFS